jgi:photosystem II stability/assembly factor-like uncharacterized protein
VLPAILLALGLVLSSGTPSQTTHEDVLVAAHTGTGAAHDPTVNYAFSSADIMGVADADVAWAADGLDLYVGRPGSTTWEVATPSNMANQPISNHVGAMDGVGADDLWLPILDVAGLAPGRATGSTRGVGIDYSSDGGRTWSFSALPGCLQTCGVNLSVSFVTPMNGYAAIGGPSEPGLLFSSHDGGATWSRVGPVPPLQGIGVGGPAASRQVVFTSRDDGWLIAGRAGLAPAVSGGTLFRTDDGGRSWQRVAGLPSKNLYSLPSFFGTRDSVVLANPSSSSPGATAVFATVDGGAHWARRSLPVLGGLRYFSPSGMGLRFAAVSPSVWRVYIGWTLYITTDSGRRWTQVTPQPPLTTGIRGDPHFGSAVRFVTFSAPSVGMAIAQSPSGCATADGSLANPDQAPCLERFPALMTTTDGGLVWEPVALK